MEIISNNKTAANTIEAEFKLDAAEFEEAINAAYLKKRKNISVPGFRKGKATRKMIETQYGESVFFEDAVNGCYRSAIGKAASMLDADIIDVPKVDVVSVSKADGVTFKAEFTTKPEVNISDYKGLDIKKTVKTIGDEDVNNELEKLQNKNARIIDVTDRAAQTGDTAIFDFKGFVDGEQFQGGTAEKFSLELGSGHFIPGFEEQMVGKNIGESFDVNVKFPEEYQAKELAGKDAKFECIIHELKGKELADLDDEFAKDVSEFDTLDELKADTKKKLEEAAVKAADDKFDTDVTNALVDKLEAEVPDVMIEQRIDEMIRDWEYKNRQQGLTIENYLKYTNSTMEQFREIFKLPAEKQVKLRLALEKIAELENIVIDEETLDKQYAELAETYKMELEKVKSVVPADGLTKDLKAEKAYDLVKENVKG